MSPIGKRIKPVWRPEYRTIVGVVSDVRHQGLQADPTLDFYMPIEQWQAGAMTAVLRTGSSAAGLESALRRAVGAVDASAPISRIQTVDQMVRLSVASPRTTAILLAGFAGVHARKNDPRIPGASSSSVAA